MVSGRLAGVNLEDIGVEIVISTSSHFFQELLNEEIAHISPSSFNSKYFFTSDMHSAWFLSCSVTSLGLLKL